MSKQRVKSVQIFILTRSVDLKLYQRRACQYGSACNSSFTALICSVSSLTVEGVAGAVVVVGGYSAGGEAEGGC